MNVETFSGILPINMFFKDVVSVNGHVKALKTAVEIEKIEHSSDLLHNILLFAVLIKEKSKFKHNLRIFCTPVSCMNETQMPPIKITTLIFFHPHTSKAQYPKYGEKFYKHSLSHHTLSIVLAKLLHSRNYENQCQTLTFLI